MRPITLTWTSDQNALIARCALGFYRIATQPNKPDSCVPLLNETPFPILFPTIEQAQTAAALAQGAYTEPAIMLTWLNKGNHLEASGLSTTWSIQPSSGSVKGFFCLKDNEAPFIPMPQYNAKLACQSHLSILWHSLTDFS